MEGGGSKWTPILVNSITGFIVGLNGTVLKLDQAKKLEDKVNLF